MSGNDIFCLSTEEVDIERYAGYGYDDGIFVKSPENATVEQHTDEGYSKEDYEKDKEYNTIDEGVTGQESAADKDDEHNNEHERGDNADDTGSTSTGGRSNAMKGGDADAAPDDPDQVVQDHPGEMLAAVAGPTSNYSQNVQNPVDGSSVKKYRVNMKKCLLCGLAVFFAVCLMGVAVFCIIYFLAPTPGEVQTSVGKIKGTVVEIYQGLEVEEFLGIPYAEKPIGELRYHDPVRLEKLPSDPYNADSYQYSCIQYLDTTFGDFEGSDMWNAKNPLSEDCLYLNVWVPKQRDRLKKTPVMVWIYGGGFYGGSSSLWVYDGKALAAYTGMIVASFNYRVGSFGFLSTGTDNRIKGNFGLKDQVMALTWIKDNVAAFGGDPDEITIFGESAGSASVALHMLSPNSASLFKRAIMQSGSPTAHWALLSKPLADERSRLFLDAVGCNNETDADQLLSCLRKLDANEILQKEWVDGRFMVFPWAPTVDGDFLTDTPLNLLKQGKFQKKEALFGANKEEGTFWILYALPGFSKDGPSLQNSTMFDDAFDILDWDLSNETRHELRALYRPQNQDDQEANRDSLEKVCGDRSFTCPVIELNQIYNKAGVKTYFYYLTHRASNEVWPPWMGVIHGADIQWVFGMPLNESRGYTPAEVEFSKTIMSYWANFAKTGDPNGASLPNWPQYNVDKPEIIEFRKAPKDFFVVTELRDAYCAKWKEIDGNRTASG